MKKLLLLASCALLSASAAFADSQQYVKSISSTTPAATVTAGKKYIIFDAHEAATSSTATDKRYALRYDNGTYVYGTQALPTEAAGLTLNYVWTAVADGDKFKFQNVGSGKYMEDRTSTSGAVEMKESADDAGSFTIVDYKGSSPDGFSNCKTVYGGSYCWDGVADNKAMVVWGTAGTAAGHPICFYELAESDFGTLSTDVAEALVNNLTGLSPVSGLTNGKTYLIYDGHSGRYSFRFDDNGTIHGTQLLPSAVSNLNAAYVWTAIGSDAIGWAFYNVKTGKYLKPVLQSTDATTSASCTDAGYATLEATSSTAYISAYDSNTSLWLVTSKGGTKWDSNPSPFPLVGWSDGTGHPMAFYEVTSENGHLVYPVSMEITDGTNTLCTINLGSVAVNTAYTVPSVPSTVGTITATSGITDGKATSKVALTCTLASGVNLAKFVNAKNRTHWATTSAAGLSWVASNDGSDGEWFAVTTTTGNNFNLFSFVQNKYISAEKTADDQIGLSDTAVEHKYWKKVDGSEGYSHTDATATTDKYFWNHRGSSVGTWSFDEGSSWFMVPSMDIYNTNKDLFTQNGGEYKTLYEKAAAFVASETATEAVKAASQTFMDLRFGFDNIADGITAFKSVVMPTVTYHVTMPDGTTQWNKQIAEVDLNSNALTVATNYFAGLGLTVTGVTSASETTTDMTISAGNLEFTVTGNWIDWYGKVGRLRSRNGGTCSDGTTNRTMDYWKYEGTNIISNANENNDEFHYTRLFILNPEIDTDGDFCVSIQSVYGGAGYYFNQTASTTPGTFETDKQLFKVCSTPALTDSDNNSYFGIALNVSGNAYVQDCGGKGYISAWNHANAQNDAGSHLAFHALTESDWENTTWTYGKYTCTFDSTKKSTAQTSPTLDNMIALFTIPDDVARTILVDNVNELIAETEAKIGTGVNTYTVSDDYTTAKTTLLSAMADTENYGYAELQVVIAAYQTSISTLTLNMPLSGKFYRFSGSGSDGTNATVATKYMSAVNNDSGRQVMVEDTNGNLPSTIFYYDGQHLVSYSTGLVIGTYAGQQTANAWKTVLSDNTYASSAVTFAASSKVSGKYTIQPSSGRYIYNHNATVDCGGSEVDEGYTWTITEVTELPIPVKSTTVGEETTKYASVYLPVAVDNYADDGAYRITSFHNGTLNQGTDNGEAFNEFVYSEPLTTVTNIQANTPLFLIISNGATLTNNCVYLPIASTAAKAVAPRRAEAQTTSENVLSGSFLATAKESGYDYYALSGATFTKLGDSDNVSAFTSTFKIATSDSTTNPDSFAIVSTADKTTSISEIGVENAGEAVIYDLQGRRVSRAAHGIFIINGKKVLVK